MILNGNRRGKNCDQFGVNPRAGYVRLEREL